MTTTKTDQPQEKTATAGADHLTKGDRFESFKSEDFAVPKSRDEEWRFTPLRRLRGLHDGTAAEGKESNIKIDLGGASDDQVEHSRLDNNDPKVGQAGAPIDRSGAQAWENTKEADFLLFKKDAVLEKPVEITVTGHGEDEVSYGTVAIEAETHAEAVVVLRYEGSGTHSDNVEITVGDGAKLIVVVLEDWNNDAVHLSNTHIKVGRDSTLRHIYAAFGGELVRSAPTVRYTAPGGDVEMLGVNFADANQFFEQRLLIDHAVRNCRSHVLYKNALQGDLEEKKASRRKDARTVWVGDVLIRADATGTDSYETNNNLLLTEGARADSIPNLEILTGEIIEAGHAATVGRFDDEQMFYMQSRGIPAAEAKMLIVRGFFTDVIRRIPIESVREQLEEKVDKELENIAL